MARDPKPPRRDGGDARGPKGGKPRGAGGPAGARGPGGARGQGGARGPGGPGGFDRARGPGGPRGFGTRQGGPGRPRPGNAGPRRGAGFGGPSAEPPARGGRFADEPPRSRDSSELPSANPPPARPSGF